MTILLRSKCCPWIRLVKVNTTDPGEGEFGLKSFAQVAHCFRDYPLILEGWHGYRKQQYALDLTRKIAQREK